MPQVQNSRNWLKSYDKLIFLDIDGVLNSHRSAIALGGYPYPHKEYHKFDIVALGLIRKICKDSGAKIVLSSGWRFMIEPREIAMELKLPIIDKTPHVYGVSRGEEIMYWLRSHSARKYVIIDDATDICREQLPYYVQVNRMDGFSYANYLTTRGLLL